MKSTGHPPSATLAKAPQTASETDAKGRLITVSRLDALQYYRLTKALGATANNPATMDLATIASSVRKIDQTDFPIPTNERDVEFVMQQLDFHGLTAAGSALAQLVDKDKPEDQADVAKN